MLASHEDTSTFDKNIGYLLIPQLYPIPCKPEHRWNFDCTNMYKTPAPFADSLNPKVNDVALPNMSDGRQYTDYRPSFVTQLCDQPTMSSSHDFRQYQIHTANDKMTLERHMALNNVRLQNSIPYDEVGTMLPEQDTFVCDKISCKRVDTGYPCLGLGTGRSVT